MIGGLLGFWLAAERHLAALHGDGYRAWAARVGRFVPLVGRLR